MYLLVKIFYAIQYFLQNFLIILSSSAAFKNNPWPSHICSSKWRRDSWRKRRIGELPDWLGLAVELVNSKPPSPHTQGNLGRSRSSRQSPLECTPNAAALPNRTVTITHTLWYQHTNQLLLQVTLNYWIVIFSDDTYGCRTRINALFRDWNKTIFWL